MNVTRIGRETQLPVFTPIKTFQGRRAKSMFCGCRVVRWIRGFFEIPMRKPDPTIEYLPPGTLDQHLLFLAEIDKPTQGKLERVPFVQDIHDIGRFRDEKILQISPRSFYWGVIITAGVLALTFLVSKGVIEVRALPGFDSFESAELNSPLSFCYYYSGGPDLQSFYSSHKITENSPWRLVDEFNRRHNRFRSFFRWCEVNPMQARYRHMILSGLYSVPNSLRFFIFVGVPMGVLVMFTIVTLRMIRRDSLQARQAEEARCMPTIGILINERIEAYTARLKAIHQEALARSDAEKLSFCQRVANGILANGSRLIDKFGYISLGTRNTVRHLQETCSKIVAVQKQNSRSAKKKRYA